MSCLSRGRPEFADKCDWEKLNGADWVQLLRARRGLADYCPWEKLGKVDQESLFQLYPTLVNRYKTNDVETSIQTGIIHAKELIRLIVSTKPVAKVENDEECYVTPKAEIVVDASGQCNLHVRKCIPSNPYLGVFRFEVGGVNISVSRGIDGPGDDYRFIGTGVLYDSWWATKENVIAAIRSNVKFPAFKEFESTYNDTNFKVEDVEAECEAALVDLHAARNAGNNLDYEDVEEESSEDADHVFFALDDNGRVYAFEDKRDVQHWMTAIDLDSAVRILVKAWVDSGCRLEN